MMSYLLGVCKGHVRVDGDSGCFRRRGWRRLSRPRRQGSQCSTDAACCGCAKLGAHGLTSTMGPRRVEPKCSPLGAQKPSALLELGCINILRMIKFTAARPRHRREVSHDLTWRDNLPRKASKPSSQGLFRAGPLASRPPFSRPWSTRSWAASSFLSRRYRPSPRSVRGLRSQPDRHPGGLEAARGEGTRASQAGPRYDCVADRAVGPARPASTRRRHALRRARSRSLTT